MPKAGLLRKGCKVGRCSLRMARWIVTDALGSVEEAIAGQYREIRLKALSVRQPWASMIASGIKTIEVRSWPTLFRGELLIVSSRKPDLPGLPLGQAIAVVRLIDCRSMHRRDEPAAKCKLNPGDFAWVLEGARRITPFEVKGRLRLFEVPIRRRPALQIARADSFASKPVLVLRRRRPAAVPSCDPTSAP